MYEDLNLIDAPVLVIDGNYRVVHANEQARRMYGDVPSIRCHKLSHDMDEPCWKVWGSCCPLKHLQEHPGLQGSTELHVHKTLAGEELFVVSMKRHGELFVELHLPFNRLLKDNWHLKGLDWFGRLERPNDYLLSKEAFLERLQDQLQHNNIVFVTSLDIVGMRFINQYYSHVAGDLVIRKLQSLIHDSVVRDNAFFTKLSNTEFLILYHSDTIEIVEHLEAGLYRKLKKLSIGYLNEVIHPRVSIVTLKLDRKRTYLLDEVLKLFTYGHESHSGTSLPSMRHMGDADQVQTLKDLARKHAQIHQMETALRNDGVDVFFQPIVRLATGEIVHLEALMRIHVGDECLAAGQFIDLLYEQGLIAEFDMAVLAWLCEYAPAIHEVTDHLFLNVTADSLKMLVYRQRLRETIDRLKTQQIDVTLELTEQVFMGELEIIRYIHDDLMIKLAVDDFGSGYSSLKLVADLARQGMVTHIKIDGSLIHGVVTDPHVQTIIRAISMISREFGLTTIAEFVEDEAIARELERFAIDMAQGYFFHRPQPLTALR